MFEVLWEEFDEEKCGIDAKRSDLEIDEKEFEYAVFCLTGKQMSSLSSIDFEVNDKVVDLDGMDTSETACTKLELPV